ncbi:ABC transporter ATP-binding protein [Dactylosporangium sp. NPDC005572]|uniref:ABC transporter ATP-binding protein n=1 Tax=Dactylosporangium sp. NPDC005572 TaxID=3156889 RepID=UPI0033A657B7
MLELSNVVVETRRGVRLADGVDLTVGAGEIVGLVGESGSGKTVTTTAVFGLAGPGVRVTGGTATLDGADLAGLDLRRVRGRDVGFVFQDPSTALHPLHRVGDQIAEAAKVHGRRVDVKAALADVGVPDPARRARQYPHELSGGQRQRVGIARALALRPRLLVLDEPVASLDVSVQAQVVNLLRDLQDRHGLAYLFIAHDLAVVASLAHRVGVMYLGRLVEEGPAGQVLTDPRHPYTRALVDAIPVETPADRRDRPVLGGEPPSPVDRPPGCAFHPRCPIARPSCAVTSPLLAGGDRRVACPHV